MVFRIYVEKKNGLDHGASSLKKDLRDLLGIKGIEELRMLNRYDVEKIEEELPKDSDSDIIFRYEDAFVNTRFGKIKINEIKYEYKYTNEKKIIAIDAQDFVKAILKDALNGEIKLIANKEVR